MHYISTNGASGAVTFREAVLAGQPDDRGLYIPNEIPVFDPLLFAQDNGLSPAEIAAEIMRPFVGGCIDDDSLFRICERAVSFPLPLAKLTDRIQALELFHGPTLAFKDVGALFISGVLSYFAQDESKQTVIIVATSGDTGGAVANAFHNVENTKVCILYPKGKVSRVQELQLTSLGGNVITLEVQGTFDQCQSLAKQALADSELSTDSFVTSANSINIARWLPQQVYYVLAMREWTGEPPVISVPSGNFGNIAAGMLAARSGLPVKRFVAATNANDTVPRFFETGSYEPQETVETISNAMDVSDPSNFVRIRDLFGQGPAELRSLVSAYKVTEGETARTMRQVHALTGYMLDPHGAVAYAALERDLAAGERGFILETAHPIKFDAVKDIVGDVVPLPEAITRLDASAKNAIEVPPDYDAVREVLAEKL